MNYLIVHLARNEAIFARFQKKRGTLVFLDAARHPLDQEHSLGELLPGVASAKREGEKIVLALPPDMFFQRELELPITDRRKIREVLPLELKGETAIECDELVFDALPLASNSVLAVWGKRVELAERIRELTAAGLEPEIVTSSSFHWSLLLAKQEDDVVAAITDGEALMVCRKGEPLLCRSLATNDPDAEIARTLAALEIGKGIAVTGLFAIGDAARRAAGRTDAGSDTMVPVPLPLSGGLAATFAGESAAAQDLAGVYAVAQACMAGEPVNFRSGSLAYTAGQDKNRRRLRITALLAAIFVLLLFVEEGVRYYLLKKDLDSVNKSIAAVYHEVFPSRKKPVDEVGEIKSEIKRLRGVGAGSSILDPLKKLAEAKGDDIAGFYEVEIDGNQVRLKGDARSFQAVNDFKARTSSIVNSAEISESKSRPDGSVTFAFRGIISGGGQ